jgi:hypothetical protein
MYTGSAKQRHFPFSSRGLLSKRLCVRASEINRRTKKNTFALRAVLLLPIPTKDSAKRSMHFLKCLRAHCYTSPSSTSSSLSRCTCAVLSLLGLFPTCGFPAPPAPAPSLRGDDADAAAEDDGPAIPTSLSRSLVLLRFRPPLPSTPGPSTSIQDLTLRKPFASPVGLLLSAGLLVEAAEEVEEEERVRVRRGRCADEVESSSSSPCGGAGERPDDSAGAT